MALRVPYPRSGRMSSNFSGRPTNTMGTTVTGGAANTLGSSFTEIFSSVTHDVHWVTILILGTGATATNTSALLNIYAGAASAETVIIPNLLAGWTSDTDNITMLPRVYQFPLFIPAGTRLTAKSQGAEASKNVYVSMFLQGGGRDLGWCGTRVEALGINTGTSKGTSLTAGTASEGTFTDIGTTGFDYGYVLPMLQGNTDTTMNNGWHFADIGVGSAQLKDLRDFEFIAHSSETSHPLNGGMGRWCRIPAGTSLQLRSQQGGTAEAMDWAIYGVY